MTMTADRLGITANAFATWPVEALLDFAARDLGVTRLDCSYRHLDVVGPHGLRKMLDARGMQAAIVSVSAYLGRVGCASVGSDMRPVLRRAIDDACVLGASSVLFHTCVPQAEDAASQVVEELGDVLEHAESSEVTLVLENNFDSRDEDPTGRNPSRRPEALVELMDLADSARLRVAYDPCNLYLAGLEAFPHGYELLAPYIDQVHLKDATRFSERRHGPLQREGSYTDSHAGTFIPVAVGSGALPWNAILGALRSDGFQGSLILEPTPAHHSVESWCLDSVTYVRSLLAST